jgi:hypothetical protein
MKGEKEICWQESIAYLKIHSNILLYICSKMFLESVTNICRLVYKKVKAEEGG